MKFWIKKKLRTGKIVYMEKNDPLVVDIIDKMVSMQYPNGNKISFVPFLDFDGYEVLNEVTRK